MRTLLVLLQKEFRQIFRDPAILRIIFMLPTVQFLVLPLAANFEFKNINLVLVDHDHSSFSRQLINKINGSGFFRLVANSNNFNEGYRFIETDEADLLIEIPPSFEKNLVREQT